jgi:UDP-N-acetylmuramoylalanine--D-glutamate ligase
MHTAPDNSLAGRTVGVIGVGMTGQAVAQVLLRLGARPTLYDTRPREALSADALTAVEELGCPAVLGANDGLEQSDLVVLSPGVSIRDPFLEPARSAGVEVIGEIELAARLRPSACLVGITGTNGKTTTTALTARILEEAGIAHALCGNIGSPLVTHVLEREDNPVFVVELSSFQLESVSTFHARAAAVLNVSDDHRDRHPEPTEYVATKMRVFANQTDGDVAVVSADCPQLSAACLTVPRSRLAQFSALREVPRGGFARDGALWIRWQENEPAERLLALDEMLLRGPHNVDNALAATCLAHAVGAPLEAAARTLRVFQPADHTLRPVGSAAGILYINDSKGTNVDATVQALRSASRPVVLIAGGSDKAADFGPLGNEIAERCRALVLIGETADAIQASAEAAGFGAIERCATLAEAVVRSAELAETGDIVLLSPACASFDMFSSYKHRGTVFESAVRELPGFTPSAVR